MRVCRAALTFLLRVCSAAAAKTSARRGELCCRCSASGASQLFAHTAGCSWTRTRAPRTLIAITPAGYTQHYCRTLPCTVQSCNQCDAVFALTPSVSALVRGNVPVSVSFYV